MECDQIAHIYDSYVATTLDVPFFLDAAGKTDGEILELMCGTGGEAGGRCRDL